MDTGIASKENLLWSGAPDYRLVAWLFLRLLALIYLAAFASLAVQITGLAGAQGIFPISEQLGSMAEQHGLLRFLAYPSLFWIASGDWALLAAAYAGCALSLVLLAGWWERAVLILLYLLYLSLYHAGQYFTNFQWDYLLLEAGFLAIFLPGGSRLVVWLFRWLLFRLRFLSGLSKLISGDPSWSGLTALNVYFETQPLPHVGAWYAHHLPEWVLRFGTGATLVVEILVPFLMFFPRRWRFLAAWTTILWQVMIMFTSNHNFFNLLTIVLCLFLFDDRAVARVLPKAWRDRGETGRLLPRRPAKGVALAVAVAAAVIVPASLVSAVEMIRGGKEIPLLSASIDWLNQYRIANRYHVFPKIETERIEVQIEGSLDGEDWRPYAFRFRPEDPAEAPAFVVPHQPRLDWMIWFVPMSPAFMDLFERFLQRLLEGSPPVAGLLADTPFGDRPPRMLRVSVYRYRFTSPVERAQTGDWWQREYLGPFFPLPFLER
ncbi:MAG: lipase maturation factor family protein [Pseudomonadota bacterium]|nr:lipase maturation factor family protein [Pseudomonadota bacterium]